MTPPTDTLTSRASSFPAEMIPLGPEMPARVTLLSPPALAPIQDIEARPAKTEVVLITHNSEADLARSLPTIREAVAMAGAELLFIDLGSVDGTRSFVARHAPGARGIWLQGGDGLTAALAAAAAASEAEVLVVLRPTVKPSSTGGIAELVEHLVEHPCAAVVAPMLRAQSGAVLATATPDPNVARFSRVEWVVTEAIAIRRSEIDALGVDSMPAHDFEQLELCIKLRCRGREIHYLRSVEWRDAGGRAARRVDSSQYGLSLRAWRLVAAHPTYALRLLAAHPALIFASDGLRRAFDIAVALVALTILSPLLLAIGIAVRLDSSGPALFRQKRLGHRARPFQMYKFRTMRHDSDCSVHERFVRDMIAGHWHRHSQSAPEVFKVHPDPRVTRLGRVLRRTSLDELPQLVNILRGEMTLVGFRPPIPYEVSSYPTWYHRRFDGKPGLTGLWQVSGRNQRSYAEMVSLDIEYFNRRTWLLDLLLLARTVGVVITGRGAY